MKVWVEKGVYVTEPTREKGQGIRWKWCFAGSRVRVWAQADRSRGRDLYSFSAESLVLTCGVRQVAWAADVETEGIRQRFLKVSQVWPILKLCLQSFKPYCHCSSSGVLKGAPHGRALTFHVHTLSTNSLSPSFPPPCLLPSLSSFFPPLPYPG